MTRIDAHVHAFPDRLAQAVRAYLSQAGELKHGCLLADVAGLVNEAGFDRAWVLPYAHRAGIAESVNEWSAAEVRNYPWLVAGATFHPGDDNLTELVERALVELGLQVVKLHCAVGQFSPADARLTPLWEVAATTGVPVVVHAGQQSPGDTEADEVDELSPVLREYPGLRVVLAHSGHPGTRRTLELMGRYPNLYADLTPVWDRHVDIGADDIRRFPGRFLFGSDSPNSPIALQTHEQRFRKLGLDEQEIDQVMGGTAAILIP
jgi:uncharacterized protein